jgi:hypothetical protein
VAVDIRAIASKCLAMRRLLALLATSALVLLSGCERLGIESPETIAAAREAEGKAVGGACRHAGRAIEDCYALNRKSDKAAVFAGWRDMNDYMRENKIEPVTPQIAGQPASTKVVSDEKDKDKDKVEAAPTEKRPAKSAAAAKAKAKGHDS